MLSAFVIVFREMLEAGLVIGIVLAATRGLPGRFGWIAAGVGAGILGAVLVAFFGESIAGLFDGSGQELMNATILLIAVAMLAWHNAWMASHGRELARSMRALGAEVASGNRPAQALAIVCGTAILREGSEVALFLYGIAASGGETAGDIIAGGFGGILAGGLVAILLYRGLIAIPMRYLFTTLSALITLLAAGLAAQAVTFLQQSGRLDFWTEPLWDSSGILAEDSMVGRVLHTLIGYFDRPDGMELFAYLLVIIAMTGLGALVAQFATHRHAGGRTALTKPQVRARS
jgi:high-affinity iron transporter